MCNKLFGLWLVKFCASGYLWISQQADILSMWLASYSVLTQCCCRKHQVCSPRLRTPRGLVHNGIVSSAVKSKHSHLNITHTEYITENTKETNTNIRIYLQNFIVEQIIL